MFTQRLKELIKVKSLTQKKIANDLDLSVQRFNFYVNGKREPDFNIVCRIADYFNVSTDYLLGHSDNAYMLREGSENYITSNPLLSKLLSEAGELQDSDLTKTIEYVQLLKLKK